MFKLFHLVVGTIFLICHANVSSSLGSKLSAPLRTGNRLLAGKLINQMISDNPDESFVVSSLSAMVPLAQLAMFSEGLALNQLLKVLNFKNKKQIKAAFPQLIAELKSPENVTLDIATKFYANKGNPLSQHFITTSRKYFDADGETLDFTQNTLAASIINEWVSNKTGGTIQDIVDPKMVNANTRLYLANSISIVADWVYPFDVRNTQETQFTKVDGKEVTVKMMRQKGVFNYYAHEKFEALEMFYVGRDLSFLTILPKDVKDLTEVVKSLNDPIIFGFVMANLKPVEISVNLPKFTLTSLINLKELLIKNGVNAIFEPNTGLKGILENKAPVHVTDALQLAYILVDERHTEAGAASASAAISASIQDTLEFNANRTFEFFLLNRIKRLVLFNGIFNG